MTEFPHLEFPDGMRIRIIRPERLINMIKPNYEDFKKLCRQGNLIPMATEMPGDLDTPLSALLKIDDSHSSFLLESVEGGERWARYSFLGSDPRAIIKSRNGTVEIHADEGCGNHRRSF